MDKQIYAVLAGINNYAGNPLDGCLNDIRDVEGWLRQTYGNTGNLFIRRLTDDDTDSLPTRANIIAAFDHFDQARDGDTCLFYFCGHGTNIGAPKVFETEAGSGAVQALICMDWQPGVPGKGYIIDKELSFLIWKATLGKPLLNFIAITDCCHSGSSTRDAEIDTDAKVRQMILLEDSPPVENYLGFDFSRNGEKAYDVERDPISGLIKSVAVKRGGHIHISAAMDTEVAKELSVSGIKRGAFSYVLVKMLTDAAGNITYRQLADYAAIKIKNLYYNSSKPYTLQHPLLNIVGVAADRRDRLFLSTESSPQESRCSIYYDAQYGWCVQKGILHSFSTGDQLEVEVNNSVRKLFVKRAGLLFSQIAPADPVDQLTDMVTKNRYKGMVIGSLGKAAKIFPGIGLSEDTKTLLYTAQFASGNSPTYPILNLADDNPSPGGYVLDSEPAADGSEAIVVRETPGKALLSASPVNILQKLAEVIKWQHIVKLSNPQSDLDECKINLEISEGVNDDGYLFTNGSISTVNQMKYQVFNGEVYNPAFRLSVSNTGSASLFISLAYLDAGCGITTVGEGGFDDLQIEPGNTQFLLATDTRKKRIELENTSDQPVTEYLKLFISAKGPIPLDSLQQNGAKADNTRGIATDKQAMDDWKTATIGFTIAPEPKS